MTVPSIKAAGDKNQLAARLVETARGLAPALRERSAQAEADWRMPDATHCAFKDAGFYRMFQRARFGGLELDCPAIVSPPNWAAGVGRAPGCSPISRNPDSSTA